MSAQAGGSTSGPNGKPRPESRAASSPAALEQAIQERREHLAATIDELSARAQPKELARRGAVGAQRKLQTLTHTPEGQLRKERLAAVAGAVVVIAGIIYLRRRR